MPYALKPPELLQAWQQYKKRCDEHTVEQRYRNEVITIKKPKIYLMEVFCCLVGLDEDDLEKLRNNRNYKKAIKQIEHAVLARKLDALVNGEGSASGLIFDLKANHGLHIKKANKAAEDQHWDITMNLGNESISEAVRKTGSREDRKTEDGEAFRQSEKSGKTGSPEDGRRGHGQPGGEEDDGFIWDSRGGGANAETTGPAGETGPQAGEDRSVFVEAVPGPPKHVDPSVVGEPIILTKQYEPRTPAENDRQVEVYRRDPLTGESFFIKMWLSDLSPSEREKYTKPKGWMPQGKYSVW